MDCSLQGSSVQSNLQSQCNPYQNPNSISAEIEKKKNLKFHMESEEKQRMSAQNNDEKNDKARRLTRPDFKTYCKDTVMKTLWD